MTVRNVCAVCMDPVADTHRYVTGFRVLYLCDGCAERLRMERCREDEDRAWPYPTYDMRRKRDGSKRRRAEPGVPRIPDIA